MPQLIERLKSSIANGSADPALLPELLTEISGLRAKVDELETLLIILVRTGWPWQEDGNPNDIMHASRDGYAAAMIRAKELLNLDHLSRITRTEPRT